MPTRIKANHRGTCPHCGTGIQFLDSSGTSPSGWFRDQTEPGTARKILTVGCPICDRPIVAVEAHVDTAEGQRYRDTRLIWPRAAGRKPIPEDVPKNIRTDYEEAALVLPDSEKASAALSRRCLQSLLREAGHTKSKDLADQIEEVLAGLPGYLQKQLDAVRNIGNFAAHIQKSKATGEIIDVEPGEAEWNLDVLDLLFDFYYEQPKIAQEKRDALNKKLAAVGKPPMK
jgi:hypothetical protein